MHYIYNGYSLKSGVYKITNTQNNRVYIGSAKEFKRRWKQHAWALMRNKHSNSFLQSDYNKCGKDVFVFEILELIDGSKEKRIERENHFIEIYFDNKVNCYNLISKAFSCEGRKLKNPEETRKKMSAAHKGVSRSDETKLKIAQANTGKKHSDETKNKLSLIHKGKIVSDETRKKMSDALKGKKMPKEFGEKISKTRKIKKLAPTNEVRAKALKANSKIWHFVNPEGNVIYITNLNAYCKQNNLCATRMYAVAHGKENTYKGYKKYIVV